MKFYKTEGVCATEIGLEIENNIITDIQFIRGCNGNTQGISALVKGMNVDDVITKLSGIHCKDKASSCPDQLAQILQTLKNIKTEEQGAN